MMQLFSGFKTFCQVLALTLFLQGLGLLLHGSVYAASLTYTGDTSQLNRPPFPFESRSSLFINSPTGNTLTVNFSAASSGKLPYNIMAGMSSTQAVSNNTLIFIDGESRDFVAAGYQADRGNALNNQLTLQGGIVGWEAYGGYSYSGNAISNKLIMSGGTVSENAYGGLSEWGDAYGNSTIMSGGTVTARLYGAAGYGGAAYNNTLSILGGTVEKYASAGTATNAVYNNTTTMRGGVVTQNLYGGRSHIGHAYGNSVVFGGTGMVQESIIGGNAAYNINGIGNATSNIVSMSGGAVMLDVIGGQAAEGSGASGNAAGNAVTMSGGTVNGNIIGGNSLNGNATGNTVTVSGGMVNGNIIGGQATGGNATGNTVILSGAPVFATTTELYGGYDSTGSSPNDFRSNNVLELHGTGFTAKNIHNFNHYEFYLPATASNGASVLTLSDANVDISLPGGVAPTIGVGFMGSPTHFNPGDSITLINATGLVVGTGLVDTLTGMQGVTLVYDFDLANPANILVASVAKATLHPQTRNLAAGRVAALTLANWGGDLAAGAGMAEAKAAAAANLGVAPFAAFSGGTMRYHTGGKVNVRGLSLMAGVAKNWKLPATRLTLAAFFESGSGKYTGTSYNVSGSGQPITGRGNSGYNGLGLMMRLDLEGTPLAGLYAELAGRGGYMRSDYNSSHLQGASSTSTSFRTGSRYYGGHVGLGYMLALGFAELDVYSRYFYLHQKGRTVNVSGDPYNFDSMDSRRLRLGSRVSFPFAGTGFSPYAGAAWAYEFDGKSRATTHGIRTAVPSLKGGSAIGELGVAYSPAGESAFKGLFINAGVEGFTGTRKGVSGILRLGCSF